MTQYRTMEIDGLKIFYREAGDRKNPTLLLLHGFPASSFMFRELIDRLSDQFHVVAPDYPGFGYSDAPPREAVAGQPPDSSGTGDAAIAQDQAGSPRKAFKGRIHGQAKGVVEAAA